MKIYREIQKLLNYGIEKNLIDKNDEIYSRNMILGRLNLDNWKDCNEVLEKESIEEILTRISDYAVSNGIIEGFAYERDILETEIMNFLTPRPSEVIKKYEELLKESSKKATNYFYNLSKDTNYIKTDRIKRNLKWDVDTEYEKLEITINLAKPEKDPKDIIKKREAKRSEYPKCLLCLENVGFKGRINHPARQNHRVIPLELGKESWYFQYSPYVYYNEHSIIFSKEHKPMKISRKTFENILEFVEKYPHYFIGSNADLPIVGGSILSHDHYQAGNHIFPMAKAKKMFDFSVKGYENVKCEVVKWPISVIRLTSENKENLTELSEKVLDIWRGYSDEKLDILAETDEPHNTITPIARRIGDNFQIDLALRNNRCTKEYPLGIFHPHEDVHNIKKENIGLIEVMGLAILPGRLKKELDDIEKVINLENWKEKIINDKALEKHLSWCEKMKEKYERVDRKVIEDEVGKTFKRVLEDAGVFKQTKEGIEGFKRFLEKIC